MGFWLAQNHDKICVFDFGGNMKDGGRGKKGLLDDVRKSLAIVMGRRRQIQRDIVAEKWMGQGKIWL